MTQWISNQTNHPHFGLERMVEMLQKRGNPHLKIPVIHIAGTNGKGSTAKTVCALLQKSQLKVGLFSSPFIVQQTDQITINGEAIPQERFEWYAQLYEDMCVAMPDVTPFEVLTAIAYDYFATENVDVAVIETGMGGRLDSTNVCQPIVTAVTNVGVDHQQFLGETVQEIAVEKAGVIKAHVPVILGDVSPDVVSVFETVAHNVSAPIYRRSHAYDLTYVLEGHIDRFCYTSALRTGWFETCLIGKHQTENAALAICIVDTYCQRQQLNMLTQHQIQDALQHVVWPSRMEIINRKPMVLLDGAHNPHAMVQLVENMKRYEQYEKTILFSCVKTKDVSDMITQLQQVEGATLLMSTFEDERAITVSQLETLSKETGIKVVSWETVVRDYLQNDATDTLLCITGSLYFLSYVRRFIVDKFGSGKNGN